MSILPSLADIKRKSQSQQQSSEGMDFVRYKIEKVLGGAAHSMSSGDLMVPVRKPRPRGE